MNDTMYIIIVVLISTVGMIGLFNLFVQIGMLPTKPKKTDVVFSEPYRGLYYKRRGTHEWVYMLYSPIAGYYQSFSVPGNERHSEYARAYFRAHGVYMSDLAEVTETHAHNIRESLDRVKKTM